MAILSTMSTILAILSTMATEPVEALTFRRNDVPQYDITFIHSGWTERVNGPVEDLYAVNFAYGKIQGCSLSETEGKSICSMGLEGGKVGKIFSGDGNTELATKSAGTCGHRNLGTLLQSVQPGSWDFQVSVEQKGQPKFADAFSASTMFFDLRKQARNKSNWEMKGLFEEEWNKGNWVKWQSTRKLSVSSTEECSLSVQLQHDELFEEKSQEKINRSFLPKILLDSKSAKKLRSMIQHPESLEKIEEEMSLKMGKDPSGLKSKCSSGQSVDGCRSAFANLIADQQIFVVEQDNRGKFECDELDVRSDYFSHEQQRPRCSMRPLVTDDVRVINPYSSATIGEFFRDGTWFLALRPGVLLKALEPKDTNAQEKILRFGFERAKNVAKINEELINQNKNNLRSYQEGATKVQTVPGTDEKKEKAAQELANKFGKLAKQTDLKKESEQARLALSDFQKAHLKSKSQSESKYVAQLEALMEQSAETDQETFQKSVAWSHVHFENLVGNSLPSQTEKGEISWKEFLAFVKHQEKTGSITSPLRCMFQSGEWSPETQAQFIKLVDDFVQALRNQSPIALKVVKELQKRVRESKIQAETPKEPVSLTESDKKFNEAILLQSKSLKGQKQVWDDLGLISVDIENANRRLASESKFLEATSNRMLELMRNFRTQTLSVGEEYNALKRSSRILP